MDALVLESLVPGLGPMKHLYNAYIHSDQSNLTTLCTLFFITTGALFYFRYTLWSYVKCWLTTSISLSEFDSVHDNMHSWMRAGRIIDSAYHLKAKTYWGVYAPRPISLPSEDNNLSFDTLVLPAYNLEYGHFYFWHNRHLIFVEYKKGSWGSSAEPDSLILRVLGWSTQPLKNLIRECTHHAVKTSRIAVRTYQAILPKDSAAYWSFTNQKQARPIHTVHLDDKIKDDLLADVRKYLHPNASSFYVRRGIPYRRGYLFHGPPGTGKTSLAFALAGAFGLPLYFTNLKDKKMSDQKLCTLFTKLPPRCIVLSEDLDCAGLEKRDLTADISNLHAQTEKASPFAYSLASNSSSSSESSSSNDKKDNLSLSGLLNAIDGVCSTEGRLLIVTSNNPEKLDPALIRPGRIDKQVYFGLASKQHIKAIFSTMYSSHKDDDVDIVSHISECKEVSMLSKPAQIGEDEGTGEDLQKLKSMADRFADILPADTLTPAEIQGYILSEREDPDKALEGASAWCETVVQAKKAGKNVIDGAGADKSGIF